MKDFFEAVSRCSCESKNLVVTVIEGAEFGEKALFSDGVCVYDTAGKDGFLTALSQEICHVAEDEKQCIQGLIRIQERLIFCDWVSREQQLVVCGGGHVSIPIIQIGRLLGFEVTVVEDRPYFAEKAKKAGASQVLCEAFEDGLEKIEGSENTYFVIVTRGHCFDEICLEKILRKPHRYVGMLGSKKRVQRVKEMVLSSGISPEAFRYLYTPIGLSIGAETPEEIAVAVMAEIIQVKRQNTIENGYSKEMLREISAAEEASQSCILATIIRKSGSAPREAGTKMLMREDGACTGTIGGGSAEAAVKEYIHKIFKENLEIPILYCVNMAGMEREIPKAKTGVYGGVIEVLLEKIK